MHIAIYFLNYKSVTMQYTFTYTNSYDKVHKYWLKCYFHMQFDIKEYQ
jgi:hypothetical protein